MGQTIQRKQRVPKKPTSKSMRIIREYAEALIIAAVAAFLIRAFVIQAFRIPTASMEDTLLVGDFLLVNKFIYGAKVPFFEWRLPKVRDPKPGDVIVFKYPRNPKLDYIKRLIAVHGQTVEIKDKIVYVDGKKFESHGVIKFIDPRVKPSGIQDYDIFPKDSGNRDNCLDSRYWGFLPQENVIGEALIIYFSWNSQFPFYRIFSKIRWSRICDLIH